MKAVVAYLVVAVLLLAAGGAVWSSGQLERRLADVHKQIVTLRYAEPVEEYGAIEESIQYTDRLPWIANVRNSVREQRATSAYWLTDYGSLELPRDASGALVEEDPRILLLAANAAYRSTKLEGDERQAVRQLEGIMSSYVEVLRKTPGDGDAAYNYEFVVRLRDVLARPRRPGTRTEAVARLPEAPLGESIHGNPGGPPPGSDMVQFKVVIPKRSDERNDEQTEAGKGTKKVRKG